MKKFILGIVLALVALVLLVSVISFVAAYDVSCQEDTDCKLDVPLKLSECLTCDPYGCDIYDAGDNEVVAINKNWKPDCPEVEQPETCAACSGAINIRSYIAKCINNECIKTAGSETEQERNRERIRFVPAQKRNESECIEGCKCTGAVVLCKTETGREMTITAGSSGKTITISIERSEEEGEVCKTICKEKCIGEECESRCKEKCKNISVETGLELEQESENNKTKLKAKLSNGKLAEVKIMPDTASQRALERLRLKVCSEENNCTIELKEVGKNILAYELQAERHARILGIFQAKMKVKAEVNAESGEIIKVKKAWWAFLAVEGEE